MIEQIITFIIIITICIFLINMFSDVSNGFKNYFQDLAEKQKYKAAAKRYIERKALEEKEEKDCRFFGLFEFIFKNCESEEKIKKEYYQIIQKKLSSKYKQYNLQVFILNRLYLECVDFSIIDELVSDLIDMFEYFSNANSKKSIKTYLKFSLLAQSVDTSFARAQKILLDINKIGLSNQVIVDSEFYNQYQKAKLGLFDFHSKGLINLPQSDENMEIYRLIRRTQ